jgi:hypothetical protein
MTISKISIYTGTLIPDCVPEKVAYLIERAGTLGSGVGTLVFQPHRHFEFSGALFIKLIQSKTALVQAMQS